MCPARSGCRSEEKRNKNGRRSLVHNREWLKGLGVYRLKGEFSMRERNSDVVNTVEEPCAGEPYARFDEGLLGGRRA